MDEILETLKDGLDELLTKQEEGTAQTLPDAKKMNLNHAIVLTDKYFQLEKRLEILKFWMESEKTKIEKQQKFLEDCCEGFMQNYMEQCGAKQLILPNGHKFGLRKCQDSIEIDEEKEEKTIEWCKENLKEACKTETHLLKKPIITYIKSTGNVPDGIKFITGESKKLSFSIS